VADCTASGLVDANGGVADCTPVCQDPPEPSGDKEVELKTRPCNNGFDVSGAGGAVAGKIIMLALPVDASDSCE